ncbi:hypothetical protein VP01_463g3 [Puccinia sorghi]|uniref:Uncharacterized protein n=1 Tax=Puccinia sorghi TaxID=27349 RepID=A0A0L6UQA1_9BASI|nr:hypothetical protein VP01_463g3 [Puccinia sorghi]
MPAVYMKKVPGSFYLMHSHCEYFTVTVLKHLPMQTGGFWMTAGLKHATCQLQAVEQVFFLQCLLEQQLKHEYEILILMVVNFISIYHRKTLISKIVSLIGCFLYLVYLGSIDTSHCFIGYIILFPLKLSKNESKPFFPLSLSPSSESANPWIPSGIELHVNYSLEKKMIDFGCDHILQTFKPSCHPNSTYLHMCMFWHSHWAVCTLTVHQSLAESPLENGWSNNRSFLGVSACQLQVVKQGHHSRQTWRFSSWVMLPQPEVDPKRCLCMAIGQGRDDYRTEINMQRRSKCVEWSQRHAFLRGIRHCEMHFKQYHHWRTSHSRGLTGIARILNLREGSITLDLETKLRVFITYLGRGFPGSFCCLSNVRQGLLFRKHMEIFDIFEYVISKLIVLPVVYQWSAHDPLMRMLGFFSQIIDRRIDVVTYKYFKGRSGYVDSCWLHHFKIGCASWVSFGLAQAYSGFCFRRKRKPRSHTSSHPVEKLKPS